MASVDAAATEEESFSDSFVTKLQTLNETQQSINTLSYWLRYHHKRSKQAAEIWAAELLAAPPARHLLFIYLINDILQTSRRRHPELCDHFSGQLEQVLPRIVASASQQVRDKIARVVNVWAERSVASPQEIERLRSIISPGGARAAAPPPPPLPAAPMPRPVVDSRPSAAASPRAPITDRQEVSLASCLESLLSSDVLDSALHSTQTDSNLALVLNDAPIEDPSQLGVALGRADAALELVQHNTHALRTELQARKRLILLLCTAVEHQGGVCAAITAALEEGQVALDRVIATRSKLDLMQSQADEIAGMAAD